LQLSSIISSRIETASPIGPQSIPGAETLAIQLHATAANPEIVSQREPELPLDQNDAMLGSKLTAVKDKVLASTIAFLIDIAFLYRLLRHPDTPWYSKGMLFLPLMYLCSPIQLIPSFIPVIGQLDDVFVIWIAKRFAVKLVDARIRKECYAAAASIKLSRMQYEAKIRPSATCR
jgi:uncharacterized membrane protein YkvA (DUF1232 family)